jgi:hypothetical protein
MTDRHLAIFLGLLLLCVWARDAQSETIDFFPVLSYAGKTKQQVENSLGRSQSCEKIKYGLKCLYENKSVEVVYIGGIADWISVHPKNQLFSPSSVSAIGLPNVQPTFSNEHVIRWEGVYPGLLSVSAFPGEGWKVWYFYVKAKTP